MSVTESSVTRSRLRRVLWLGAGVVTIILLGACGVMAYGAMTVDRVAAETEQRLVARTIDRRLQKLTSDIVSATVWDEAWAHTEPRFDDAWLDVNVGGYYDGYMQHDWTLAYDGEGQLRYVWLDGARRDPIALAGFSPAIAWLVTRVRRDEQRRADAGAPGFGLDGVSKAAGLVQAEGDIWLVAVSTVVPETENIRRTAAPAPVVVSARRLGPDFLTGLQADLGLEAPRVITAGEAFQGARISLEGEGGDVLGQLAWIPAKPGLSVIGQLAPAFLGGVGLFLVFSGFIGFRLHLGFRALANNDSRLALTMNELTRALERAEAASVAKSQFLANMSHEIRTPLNGVLGMAQIMERGDLNPAQRTHLGVIQESGRTLLILLNDLLDLAKIEAGKLELSRSATDLEAVVDAACEAFGTQARDKGLVFCIEVDPKARGLWSLDRMRLTQVLGNLVSNAVKFTSAGFVSITVELSAGRLRFIVADSGPGIPSDRVAEIFEKFSQLDASTTRAFGGTGLGLAICRDLVALMGGALTVRSEPGQGATFQFDLPADR